MLYWNVPTIISSKKIYSHAIVRLLRMKNIFDIFYFHENGDLGDRLEGASRDTFLGDTSLGSSGYKLTLMCKFSVAPTILKIELLLFQ